MKPATEKLWAKQNQHQGDDSACSLRWRPTPKPSRVLYPGSFVDIAASFVFPVVTYVDSDRRAAKFFDDIEGVDEIVSANQASPGARAIQFIAGDYRDELDLPDESFDLLVSLYAGSSPSTAPANLAVGGHLLVNPSHGDAAMASLDPRYQLAAVIKSGGDTATGSIPRTSTPTSSQRSHRRSPLSISSSSAEESATRSRPSPTSSAHLLVEGMRRPAPARVPCSQIPF